MVKQTSDVISVILPSTRTVYLPKQKTLSIINKNFKFKLSNTHPITSSLYLKQNRKHFK